MSKTIEPGQFYANQTNESRVIEYELTKRVVNDIEISEKKKYRKEISELKKRLKSKFLLKDVPDLKTSLKWGSFL